MTTITVSDLKSALAGLSKVTLTRSRIECLRCLRVESRPGSLWLSGSDLDMHARYTVPQPEGETNESFLLPIDRIQSVVRLLPAASKLYLEPGAISFDLGGNRVTESVEAPDVAEFTEEPPFDVEPIALPEDFAQRFAEAMTCSSTDSTRFVLNGIALDATGGPGGHHVVGTDGRHLFSANGLTLPLSESVIIPNHRLLLWRGLVGLPSALAAMTKNGATWIRLQAGPWTITFKAIDGNYPNWRQVIPKAADRQTTITLPNEHSFKSLVTALPGSTGKDKPVDLVVADGQVSVRDQTGNASIVLDGATAKGVDITIRLNRDYLTKAFDFGMTEVGLIDPMSPLSFTHGGRQLVVMPLRVGEVPTPASATANQPTPSESQPERKPVVNTIEPATGAQRSNNPATPEPDKPALEAAITKLDEFKMSFRESLAACNELTTLLRQAVREQKTEKKEVQVARQTLRSLQSVRI